VADALSAYQAVLERAPGRETSLAEAAAAAEKLGRTDLALECWRHVIAVNPLRWHYHSHLARLLAERRDFDGALAECAAALRLTPSSTELRTLQVSILLASGKKDRARAAFEALVALQPPRQAELRRWFDAQMER
jgi:tetratricopeptide (TPR) repeat protein